MGFGTATSASPLGQIFDFESGHWISTTYSQTYMPQDPSNFSETDAKIDHLTLEYPIWDTTTPVTAKEGEMLLPPSAHNFS